MRVLGPIVPMTVWFRGFGDSDCLDRIAPGWVFVFGRCAPMDGCDKSPGPVDCCARSVGLERSGLSTHYDVVSAAEHVCFHCKRLCVIMAFQLAPIQVSDRRRRQRRWFRVSHALRICRRSNRTTTERTNERCVNNTVCRSGVVVFFFGWFVVVDFVFGVCVLLPADTNVGMSRLIRTPRALCAELIV